MLLRAPAAIKLRDWKIWYHGHASLLDAPLNALFCSRTCPGEKILEAVDLAQRWRTEEHAVISGFHTPVEKECLRIFLRGPQRIVICPARGLDPFQLPPDWQQKFTRDELLIISPFDSSIRRPTKETAEIRTRLVLSLAQSKTIIHASPGGFLSRLFA
ncbi:MAG TPA: hypothetical protein DCK99_10815 [Blastocatellia bacterium]|nr:hypothetical protein [Blastocatellia bacterium]